MVMVEVRECDQSQRFPPFSGCACSGLHAALGG